MKTLLVLTDHSFSAFNAARYALAFAGTFESSKVVLYHSFNYMASSAGELASVSAGFDSLKLDSRMFMDDLLVNLEPFRKPGTMIETLTDERLLTRAVTDLCRDFQVDMIIAGSKNRAAAGMVVIGSSIIDLINDVDAPMLVVPHTYIYEPVSFAVLTTDLVDVDKIPAVSIHQFLEDYRCRLLVLNVNHPDDPGDVNQVEQIRKLHQVLEQERADYHYINHEGISRGIREFCDKQHAGLVIVVHKEHSLIHKLLYSSVSREMSLQSNIPVLILQHNRNDS